MAKIPPLAKCTEYLTRKGVRVSNDFAINGQAYRDMLDESGAWPALHALLDDVDKPVIEALS